MRFMLKVHISIAAV